VFGQHVVLRHPHKIRIGDNVVIDDNCLLDAKGDDNRGIDIASGVFIGRNSILSCKNGDLVVGEGANIGFNCELFSRQPRAIGTRTLRGVLLSHRRRSTEAIHPARALAGRARRQA
jgi:acetyltransferase-like isoleucine patch superfamily enzyme